MILKISDFLTEEETRKLLNAAKNKSPNTAVTDVKKRVAKTVRIPVEYIEPFQVVVKSGNKDIMEHFDVETFGDQPYGVTVYLTDTQRENRGTVLLWEKKL
jgi:hypothetical protein